MAVKSCAFVIINHFKLLWNSLAAFAILLWISTLYVSLLILSFKLQHSPPFLPFPPSPGRAFFPDLNPTPTPPLLLVLEWSAEKYLLCSPKMWDSCYLLFHMMLWFYYNRLTCSGIEIGTMRSYKAFDSNWDHVPFFVHFTPHATLCHHQPLLHIISLDNMQWVNVINSILPFSQIPGWENFLVINHW